VSANRRELILAGGCAALVTVLPGSPAFAVISGQRLLTDDAELVEAAVSLAPGQFVDDALVSALPRGDYLARLSPANALLLLEVLRSHRIAARDDGVGGLSFKISRHT